MCDSKQSVCFIPRQALAVSKFAQTVHVIFIKWRDSPVRRPANLHSPFCACRPAGRVRGAPSSPRAPITGRPASPCRQQTWCAAQLRTRSLKLAPGNERGAHRCKESPPPPAYSRLVCARRISSLVCALVLVVKPAAAARATRCSSSLVSTTRASITALGSPNQERHFYETAP